MAPTDTTAPVYKLRPYQADASDRGLAFLQRRGGPAGGLIVAPTGSGKSLIIAAIVSQLDGPAIVFQPSKEILEQNAEKLRGYGYEPAIFSASMGQKRIDAITLATIGSVRAHVDQFAHFRHVLIDEAHTVSAAVDKETNSPKAMYGQFLQGMTGARVLGLTATPYRLSHDGYGGSILKFLTRTRPRVFSELVHQTPIADLVRDGYWARLAYECVPGVDRTKLRLNSTGADYTDASVQRLFDDIGFESLLARTVRRVLERGSKGILVFTRFVREAEALAAELPGFAVVTGETPVRERTAMLADFRAGRIAGVANVGVLAVGFDYPELDTVVLARPTVSLALYYQMVGRVVRPHDSKAHGLVVDLVGLVEQFGRVEDLAIVGEGKRGDSWVVKSNGKALTNTYFGDRDGRPEAKRDPWKSARFRRPRGSGQTRVDLFNPRNRRLW